MQLQTLRFDGRAWSEPFSELDSPRTLVLVFGATEYLDDPEAVREIAATYPSSHIIGCSSSGEIHGDLIYDGSLSVAVARFDSTEVRSTVAPIAQETSAEAGRELASGLVADDLASVLVLSPGLGVNGTDLVEGLNEVLGADVLVTGGLAGDADRFERTWTIVDGKPAEGFVSAVGFYGDSISVGHGSQGGWDKFGPERIVTRSRDNILYELDGEPALDLYKTYLGDLAADLPASGLLFPLALREDETSEKQLVRTILGVDEQAQALLFAGDIPVGHRAQLMQANFDRLLGGAEEAATLAGGKGALGPHLTVAISCVGRRLVLGERAEDEIEAIRSALPDDSHQVGFYSYGELSPYGDGTCDLHNQTMTLTVIAEQS